MRSNNFKVKVKEEEEVGKDTSIIAGKAGSEDSRNYRRGRFR